MLEEILKNWKEFYEIIKNRPEIESLEAEIERCYNSQSTIEGIEPKNKDDLLKGLKMVSLEDLKVVILGNKPISRSNGLAFGSYGSSKEYSKIVGELENEFENVEPETCDSFTNRISKQGVLMLDICPTSLMNGKVNTHANLWSFFINSLIQYIYDRGHLVWLIWSQQGLKLINSLTGANKDNGGNKKSDNEKRNVSTNILLKSGYPVQLRKTVQKDEIYVKKFDGCNHFILCNNYLKQMYQDPIVWVQ